MPDQKTFLDDIESIKEIDLGHYHTYITEIPSQCETAYMQMAEIEIPENYKNPQNVVVCSMGGSGIGADLARTFLPDDINAPVTVHRDYDLPAYVNSNTLVVCSSFSGETEEVLSSFYDALAKKAKIFVIAGGGTLVELAKANSIPYYQFSYKSQPRATLGFVMIALLALFEKIGIFSNSLDIPKTADFLKKVISELSLETPTEKNKGKLLAYKILTGC